MRRIIEEHRVGGRWPSRLSAVVDYVPWETSGRWWENFEVRATDVSEGGFRFVTSCEVKPGSRIRLVVPPTGYEDAPVSVEGEIVWVRPPVVPLLGMYHAGVMFKPALQEGIESLLQRIGAEHVVEPVV